MSPLEEIASNDQKLLAFAEELAHEFGHSIELSPSLLSPLSRCLRAHLSIEEDILFPAAERLAGEPRYRVTAALRREHHVLRSLLGEIHKDLLLGDRAAAVGDALEFTASLRLHLEKEECLLYSVVGHGLDGASDDIRRLIDTHGPK
jgi:iron-sulfur cluster repair protein YtfE (RIC family)